MLYASPESFYKNVVKRPTAPVHADSDAVKVEDACKGLTCKLATLVGVEYLRGAVCSERLFKTVNTEPAYG
jgi:hypothetical protein